MTHLSSKTFLMAILSFSAWGQTKYLAAQRNEILSELKSHLFSCQEKVVGSCGYSECLGQIGDYPAPVLITVPQQVNSLRLHFHGHHLKLPETLPYEAGLSSMIKAFGIQESLCQSSELTVFPGSTGKNETYKNYFEPMDPATGKPIQDKFYQKFFKALHGALGNQLKESPLHLSGHSGGGKYIAGALAEGIKTTQVSVFDGIYSDKTKNTLLNWQKNTGGSLISVTVKGMSPESYTTVMRGELASGSVIKPTSKMISGIKYQVYKKDSFTHFSRYAGHASGLQAHFDVVTNLWPVTIQPR